RKPAATASSTARCKPVDMSAEGGRHRARPRSTGDAAHSCRRMLTAASYAHPALSWLRGRLRFTSFLPPLRPFLPGQVLVLTFCASAPTSLCFSTAPASNCNLARAASKRDGLTCDDVFSLQWSV